jgi:hypothetical protein
MVSSSRLLSLMPIPTEPDDSPSILIVAALPEELDHPGVLHTGVGKLNAAYALTRELQRRRSLRVGGGFLAAPTRC